MIRLHVDPVLTLMIYATTTVIIQTASLNSHDKPWIITVLLLGLNVVFSCTKSYVCVIFVLNQVGISQNFHNLTLLCLLMVII